MKAERALRGGLWAEEEITCAAREWDDYQRLDLIVGFRIARRKPQNARLLRGGSWSDIAAGFCLCACRDTGDLVYRHDDGGFRVTRRRKA
jgi:formylglycine-generating enzyme required for sulfatase activity